MRRIFRTSRGDALVLAVTFLSTLALQLEFAIFVGVLASLLVYLKRTTHPHLTPVTPDRASPQRRFVPAEAARAAGPVDCPQLALLRVDGSLFFGAVEHVRDELHAARVEAPDRRHILLIGSGINFIDVAGAELLVAEAKLSRDAGGALYLCNLKPAVRELARARRPSRPHRSRSRVRHQGGGDSHDLRAARSAPMPGLPRANLQRVRDGAAGRHSPGAAQRCRTQSMK